MHLHPHGTLAPQQLRSLTAIQTMPPCRRARNSRRQHVRLYHCQAIASARPDRKSKHPFAQPKPKIFGKPGSSDRPQQPKQRKTKHPDEQEAADLAFLRQQKASNASKKVLRVSGLQRAAAIRGHSPTAEPFSVALAAYKVGVIVSPPVVTVSGVTC